MVPSLARPALQLSDYFVHPVRKHHHIPLGPATPIVWVRRVLAIKVVHIVQRTPSLFPRNNLTPESAVCEANRSKPAGLDDASEELAGARVFRGGEDPLGLTLFEDSTGLEKADAFSYVVGDQTVRNRPICHPLEVFVVRMLVFWLRRGRSGNTLVNLVEGGE